MSALLRGVLTAVIAATCAATAAAQEVGIYHTRAGAGMHELDGAQGVGAFLLVFAPGLNVRGTVYSVAASTVRPALTCMRVLPPLGCVPEDVRRDTRLRGVALSAALPVASAARLELELAGGLSFNMLEASDTVPSGRRSALWTDETGQIGALASLTLRARPLLRLPLVVHATAGGHRIRLTACGEYAGMDDPFCGSVNLRELRVGMGYEISRPLGSRP